MSANDVVISGMSGRFPLSDNTDEFAHNLYEGVDMITEDDSRWPLELYGMNQRMGKLFNYDKFDLKFFGIMKELVEEIDPQGRLLLETTYEAIVDAGINPQSLRGSRTGVYIGAFTYPKTTGYPEELQLEFKESFKISARLLFNLKALYANRISFAFDFMGPSLITDTACSSSLTSFNLAMNDLKLGYVDYAIVGGTHMTLEPYILQAQQEMGVVSPRGVSAVLDQSADGFIKSEAIACVLLQKRSTARRVYGTVVSSRVNTDGKKTLGMFFPSSEAQEQLMVMSYKEANVDPLDLTYFEAHCTGTKAGDPQEMKAIYNAYCAKPNRTHPLPLGLLKSNMGHCEAASGVSSLIKVIISFENELIPGNKNLKQIKDECKEYFPPLHPINENLKYKPGLTAINNFGIGGANGHLLVEPNHKVLNDSDLRIAETIPRVVNICGRTEEAIQSVFDFIEKNPNKISRDFLALLGETMKQTPDVNSGGFPFRGSIFIKKLREENNEIKYEYRKQFSKNTNKSLRPLWFLFPGLGGQWPAMAKALMPIDIFRDKIEECHQILSEFDIDLKDMLLSEDKTSMSTMTAKFCSTTALEIALFEVLKALDITPDGIIGHSFGEIACAYADGCLTTREAMVVTSARGEVTESDKSIPKGLMAVVGMSKDEAKKYCSKGLYVVCNNAKNTVVISGIVSEMKDLIKILEEKGIFVRVLESNEIPYHSKYLKSSEKLMIEKINEYLKEPKLRSKKWLSTSVLNSDVEELKYASAEYFAYNLLNPVQFYEQFKQLPPDAIVVELSSHSVFSKIVGETLESSSYISLMKKDSNETNLDLFLTSIAKLYELGLNPSIENLYPGVKWPVSRGTQSISSLLRWDHSIELYSDKYPDINCKTTASDMRFQINFQQLRGNYFLDHVVDGKVIFPATGYIMLAWKQLAASLGRVWCDVPVVFEMIQFKRAVFLNEFNATTLKVELFKKSGDFNILENDNICCSGRIYSSPEEVLLTQNLIHENKNKVLENEFTLERDDIYKELRIMGYDYGKEFKRLLNIRTNDFKHLFGSLEWTGNFVTFLDSLLQSMAFVNPFRKLMVPVMIKSLRIDPKVLFSYIRESKTSNEKSSVDDIKDDMRPTNAANVDQNEDLFQALSTQPMDVIAEKLCLYESKIPFYFDSKSKLLLTHGIEVENVMAFPIPRKVDTQDLVLDSYEFVANDDMNAINECDKKVIIDYIEACNALALRLKQSEVLKTDTDIDIKSDDCIKGFANNDKKYIIFNTLENIRKQMTDENENPLDSQTIKCPSIESKLNEDIINDISNNERLIRSLVDIVSENMIMKNEIKVLEINLKNNLLVKELKNYLSNFAIHPTEVDYKVVVKTKDNLDQQMLNNAILWDVNQTIALPQNHFIVLRDSQELWQLNDENFIQDMNDSIIENGFLLSIFKYKFTEPELTLNSMNGRKRLNDSDLNKRINDFIKTANNLGFHLICGKCDSISTKTLLFRKVTKTPKIPTNEQIIQINTNYKNWFELLKEKLLQFKESMNGSNIWLIADNSQLNGVIGLMKCLLLEPGGENLRCIFDCDNSCHEIDFNRKPFSDILDNDLVINVIKDGKVGTYRHLRLEKDFDKTVSNQYFLSLCQTRDLSSLQWFDSKNIVSKEEVFDINNNKINKILIDIYSTGIAFHDVMVATGRIPSGTQLLFTDCLIGCEFAGRRSDSGVRVMGFEMSRCFATSICANDLLFTDIPVHWSMIDAITILSTYSTAWYALIERANMKKNESVLIHSGAGGVGQAAINICQYYNCDIFVTVGTEEKKQFLINEYNIPENRIFSSRDIMFKIRIMKLTEGKGVDIVLNSLAEEKLCASYECVANGGRFLELGKYDLAQNRKLGMFDFLRDVSFIGISVDLCLVNNRYFAQNFFHWMHKNCTNGCVKPLNSNVFNANEAEKAFRYMTTGRHIGKVVIKIRDEESDRMPLKAIKPAMDLSVMTKTYFNPNKVYIITGGLGGFGLELVHWMLFLGAKKFVLTSRTGLKSNYQKFIINRLKIFGNDVKYFSTNILISTADCLTLEGAQQLVSEAKQLGPIGGVFHLALELNDKFMTDMNFEKFRSTVETKYRIFFNLDQITNTLPYSLDYFVVFSSIACGLGNWGQTNYAFGNSMCESICEERRRKGQHGLAIQYGPIGDVGVIADSANVIQFITVQKQRIHSCCEVLDKLLTTSQPIVTSFVRNDQVNIVGDNVNRKITELWKVIGIDLETTPHHLTLGEIGIESLFAVEIQQILEKEFNTNIGLNIIKLTTVEQLRQYEQGQMDKVKSHILKLKRIKDNFIKYKFIFPTESHTRLNSVKSGKPVYFMPPMEITFSVLEEMAKKINRPVIGLNWTRNMNELNTMEEINNYYVNLMQKLSPNCSYDVVGYFDSALICAKLLRKGRADKAIIIDVLSDNRFSEEHISSDFILEFIVMGLCKEMPEYLTAKILRELRSIDDINGKVKKFCADMKDMAGKGLITTDMEEIFNIAIKRAHILIEYRNKKKKTFSNNLKNSITMKFAKIAGKLIIIKPSIIEDIVDRKVFTEKSREMYFLPPIEESHNNIIIDCIENKNSFEITNERIDERVIQELN